MSTSFGKTHAVIKRLLKPSKFSPSISEFLKERDEQLESESVTRENDVNCVDLPLHEKQSLADLKI